VLPEIDEVGLPPGSRVSAHLANPTYETTSHLHHPHLAHAHNNHPLAMQVTIPGRGTLQGSTLLDSAMKRPKCHRFSAVPYALPPVGIRRWRKPEPLPPTFSYESKEYKSPSSVCPQPRRVFGTQFAAHNEDCLQSNIYIPIGTPPPNGWPVVFFIRQLPFLVSRLV
jgi:Carboxylesterase family